MLGILKVRIVLYIDNRQIKQLKENDWTDTL
jgi:hypothetical protein